MRQDIRQLIVQFDKAYVLDIPESFKRTSSTWLSHALSRKLSPNSPNYHEFRFFCQGKLLSNIFSLQGINFLTAQPAIALLGGKGGFGATLRSQGKSKKARRTLNFNFCRDLQGRRLKYVNDEIRLKNWLSDAERAKRDKLKGDYKEAKGEAGIEGWYLGVPSWSETVGTSKKGQEYRKRLRKTEICRDWAAARASSKRGPPPDAPAWWGCPRGRFCEFAHGEDDLLGEAAEAAKKRKQEAKRIDKEKQLAEYTKNLYYYDDAEGGESDMLSVVSAGLNSNGTQNKSSQSSSSRRNVQSGVVSNLLDLKTLTLEDVLHGEEDLFGAVIPSGKFDKNNWIRVVTPFWAESDGVAVDFSSLSKSDEPEGESITNRLHELFQRSVEVSYVSSFPREFTDRLKSDGHAVYPSLAHMIPPVLCAAEESNHPAPVALLTGRGEFSTVWVDAVSSGRIDYDSLILGAESSTETKSTPKAFVFYYEICVEDVSNVIQIGWIEAGPGANKKTASSEEKQNTEGAMQLGPATQGFCPNLSEFEGVGDDMHSWSYDGFRGVKWHGDSQQSSISDNVNGNRSSKQETGKNSNAQTSNASLTDSSIDVLDIEGFSSDESDVEASEPSNRKQEQDVASVALAQDSAKESYGVKWKVGDIIGCSLCIFSVESDLQDSRPRLFRIVITYSCNGEPLGNAFEFYREYHPKSQGPSDPKNDNIAQQSGTIAPLYGFFPCISLAKETSLYINVGIKPFVFDPVAKGRDSWRESVVFDNATAIHLRNLVDTEYSI